MKTLFARISISWFAILFCMAAPSDAEAGIVAKVDLSRQRMHVYVDGVERYIWPVSTARRGYRTPIGRYRPKTMKRMHYSSKYNNSPMPHSIFFRGGYAIHGTSELRSLGRPVSHGCIRLHPDNARNLYGLIKAHGRSNSLIVISR